MTPAAAPIRQTLLVQRLGRLEGFSSADAGREQVVAPLEPAAAMLYAAVGRDDLVGRTVVDLGCGPGLLAIGAALLGAASAVGVDSDATAVEAARRNAEKLGVECSFVHSEVAAYEGPAETVLMNPPFGAQRRHADRPFWETAFRVAGRRIYAFASASSRTFIADSAVARGARVEAIQPVPWRFPRTFPHHRKRSVELPVDLWVLSPRATEDDRNARP